MLYSIYQIQSKLAQNPEYRQNKAEIMQFFHMNNIFNNLHVKNAYTSDNHPPVFLDQKDIEKICVIAQTIFNLKFDYTSFYEGKNPLATVNEKEAGIKKYIVANFEDVEKIIEEHYQTSSYGLKEQEKEKKKQERKDKEAEILAKHIEEKKQREWAEFNRATNLKRDFDTTKIVSIDFEFYLKNKVHTITEMGISISENNNVKNYHYLIDGAYQMKKNKHLQNSFHFGETKIIKLEDVKFLLEEALKNTNYVLFHEQREDFEILKGLDVNINSNVAIIDTQLCYKRYFRERGSLPNGEPLESLLESFNVPLKDTHNAGNDAYYTLMLLKEMQQTLLHSEKNKVVQTSVKKKKM